MEKIKSLLEAQREFATQEQCEAHLEKMRWPDGVTCPRCGAKDAHYMESRRKWQCKCKYQFSVTAGTIFPQDAHRLTALDARRVAYVPFAQGHKLEAA